jgi:hypothetical protein
VRFSSEELKHFSRLLSSMTTPEQMARIHAALTPIVEG